MHSNGIALALAILHIGPVVGTLIDVSDSNRTTSAEVFIGRGVSPNQKDGVLQITSSALSIRHDIRSPAINQHESNVERSPNFELGDDVSSEINENAWGDYSHSGWQGDASVGLVSQLDIAINHGGTGGDRYKLGRSLTEENSNTYGFRKLGMMKRPPRGRMAGKGGGMRRGKGGGMRGGKGGGMHGSVKSGGNGKGIDNGGSKKQMMMGWGGKKGMNPDLATPMPADDPGASIAPLSPVAPVQPDRTPPPSNPPLTKEPSDSPVVSPSDSPVAPPSDSPVVLPSEIPVASPSDSPVAPPFDAPSKRPTPKSRPSRSPTRKPKTQAPDAVVAPVPPPSDATSDAPVAATDAPVAATDAPVAATDAPVTATDSPSGATDSPSRATDAPVATTDSPSTASDAPVTATEAPTSSPSVGSSESAYPTPTGSFTRCFVSDSPDIGCPDADIGEKCDKFNPSSSFSSCLATCIDAFCCIHDSPSKRATSCSQEKNCVFFDPCYIVWFALHDTIGPAPYIRLNQNEAFFDVNAAELQQIFVDRPDFFEQMFGHHFLTDDLPLDDATFVDSNNW